MAPTAEEIWKRMDRTPSYLRGTEFERIFTLAAQHFAEVYRSARGHKIDPAYVAALPFDFLIALASVLEAGVAAPTDVGSASLSERNTDAAQ